MIALLASVALACPAAGDLRQLEGGWLLREEELRPAYASRPEGLEQLGLFAAELAEKGTVLLMLPMPPRLLWAWPSSPSAEAVRLNYEALLERLREQGVLSPDLLSGAPPDFYFRRDHHWTPAGVDHAAARIAAEVRDLRLPAVEVQRRWAGEVEVRGSLARTWAQRCGETLEPERYQLRHSAALAPGAGLLHEGPPASVLLLGTSNSNLRRTDDLDVAGALIEALGADVHNGAIQAGGVDGALLSWLGHRRGEPLPRLVIWEMGGAAPVDDPLLYRQARALLRGRCEAPAQAWSLGPEPSALAWEAGEAGGYLWMDPDQRPDRLRLRLRYAEGPAELVQLHPSPHAPAGPLGLMLPTDRKLRSLEGWLPRGGGLQLQLRRCAAPPDSLKGR